MYLAATSSPTTGLLTDQLSGPLHTPPFRRATPPRADTGGAMLAMSRIHALFVQCEVQAGEVSIKDGADRARTLSQKRIDAMKTAIAAQAKADADSKAGFWLGLIGKIVAAVASVIVAVATGGAALPLVVITCAAAVYCVVDATMDVASAISTSVGGPELGLNTLISEAVTKIAMALGSSASEAKKIGDWTAVGVAVFMAVLGLAGGGAAIAGKLFGAAGKAASSAVAIGKISTSVQTVAVVADAAAQTASASVDGVTATDHAKVDEMNAVEAALNVQIAQTDHVQQDDYLRIKMLLDVFNSSTDTARDIVENNSQTRLRIARLAA